MIETGLSLLQRMIVTIGALAAAPYALATETVEYVHTDALGSPVAVTDASGGLIERTVYEPFGAVVNRPLTDGPGYAGHVTDTVTGLSYMQQRYYDFDAAVFLSVDPVSATVQAFGRYSYANSNPYRFVDPDGRASQERGARSRRVATVGSRIKGGGVAAGGRVGTLGGTHGGSGVRPSSGSASSGRSEGEGWISEMLQPNAETEAVAAYGAGLRYTRDWKSKKDSVGIVVVGAGARAGVSKAVTGLPALDIFKVGYRWGAVDAPVDIVGSFALGPAAGTINFDPGRGVDLAVTASTHIGGYTGVSVMFDDTILEKAGK